jgi:AcrR family transcriptional regulator
MARPALTARQRSVQDCRHHRRLLRAMAACVGQKGYAATTIADVVREARVSKSTFYAHFADKEECYVALYSAASDNVLRAMRAADRQAAAAALPWRAHLRAVNAAYLEVLAGGGELTRSLLVEVQAAGPSAAAMRRDVLSRYVALMRDICDALGRDDPRLRPLPPAIALGVVGGVNEIVMEALETGPAAEVPRLVDVVTDLWAAQLSAPADAAG